MKLLQNVLDWTWGQIIGDVPEDSAICEYDCRKSECTDLEWQNCMRRLQRAAGELMPAERSRLEALSESTPVNNAMPPRFRPDFEVNQSGIGTRANQFQGLSWRSSHHRLALSGRDVQCSGGAQSCASCETLPKRR
jgi:hypothetical protein